MEYLKLMTNYFIPLFENEYYHIYNRGNNGDNIFFEDRNYFYFLAKFKEYFEAHLSVYAYCLLPNHFHFLISINNFACLSPELRSLKKGAGVLTNPNEILSETFRRFFLSYSKSIKKQELRTGSLFEKNFKRIKVDSDAYFTSLINYIHRNPQTHRLTADYKNYQHSSFAGFLSDRNTLLKRKEVLDWFGERDEFIKCHEGNPVYKNIEHLIIE
jgi:putative transposase